jgi:hypothetical protein
MNWKLQAAGLVSGAALACIPLFFGVQSYSSPGGDALNSADFFSSWNNIASFMQYPLLVSLVLVILGIAWRGPFRHRSAWALMFTSFSLGCLMLFSLSSVAFTTIDYPSGVSATVAAQNILAIGLLVPTLSFFSNLIWLFWDGWHNPKTTSIPQQWQTH